MTETILLVHCGDRNKWIWPIWWEYFKKHWDFNCGIDVVWLSETTRPEYEGVETYTTGECEWSNGLIDFIKNKCTAKYIIYTIDDFMLLEPPNYKKIFELIEKMKLNNIPMIRTHNDRFVHPIIDKSKKHYRDLYGVDHKGYCMTYQVPIIEKNFLLSTIRPNENIWDAERRGCRRIRELNAKTYIYLDEVLYKYMEVIRQGVVKGARGKYIEAAKTGAIPTGYMPEDNEEYMKIWHGMRIK